MPPTCRRGSVPKYRAQDVGWSTDPINTTESEHATPNPFPTRLRLKSFPSFLKPAARHHRIATSVYGLGHRHGMDP